MARYLARINMTRTVEPNVAGKKEIADWCSKEKRWMPNKISIVLPLTQGCKTDRSFRVWIQAPPLTWRRQFHKSLRGGVDIEFSGYTDWHQITKVQRQSSMCRTWNCCYLFIHAQKEKTDEPILLQELMSKAVDLWMWFTMGRKKIKRLQYCPRQLQKMRSSHDEHVFCDS